jgi:hypothetical protein
MTKTIGVIAAVMGICFLTYLAIDYGILTSEGGLMGILGVLAGLGGYTAHQVSK